MQKKKSPSEVKSPTNSKELPATQGMLHLVRSELKADIRGLRSEMKLGFNQMDAKFNQMDSKFNQVDSKFNQLDSKLEQVMSQVSRMGFIMEEQNSRNQVVLEGLTGLYQRQDRNDFRAEEMQNLIQGLAARSRR